MRKWLYCVGFGFFSGKRKVGQNWNRTSDTRIFSPLLYRLSYLALLDEQQYINQLICGKEK